MTTRLTALSMLVGALSVSVCTPAFAHHGNAAYDGSTITLTMRR